MKWLNIIRDKHSLVFKFGLYFLAVILVAILLPSGKILSYTSIKGLKTWPYDDLVTDKDLFLTKSDSLLKDQNQKLVAESPLYFTVNTDQQDKNLNEMRSLLQKGGNSYLRTATGLLDSVFAKGVIEKTDKTNTDLAIYVVNNGSAELQNYGSFYTIESAVAFFEKQLQNDPNKDKVLEDCIKYLTVTVFYNDKLTKAAIEQTLSNQSVYSSYVKQGQTLIKEHDEITPEKRELLKFYFNQGDRNEISYMNVVGRFMLAATILAILMLYLAYFRKSIFGQNRQVTFVFLIVVLTVFTSGKMAPYGVLFFNSIPFALVAILIRIFFDSRTALFTFLITILLCSFFAADKFQFVIIQLIAGMGTVFSIAQMQKRRELTVSAAVVLLFYLVGFLAVNLFYGNEKIVTQKIFYVPYFISSILILLAYPLVFMAEKIFGFISDFTLIELCDLNTPLLRELSQKVPGTFQHSLQVANLAEEAMFHIGGSPLLVRAGAMYHDIGKMDNPRYFTENQIGEINPHTEILPEESAKIIIAHVIKGIEKAKQNKLPDQIIDFIRTHHGTTTVGFFLNNFKKDHQGEIINEEMFRYPGPIPFSKETAVLMMADGVEAASRSLRTFDALQINDLVDRIIDYKVKENQFINSDITFKDITIVKKIFKKRLMNMYHVRIEYPR